MKVALLLTQAILASTLSFAQVIPLPNAHAHNDYEHDRPLFDALSNGFTSVEADIFLIKDELYVAHNKPASTKNARTLKELYLQPLDEVVRANNGQVYPGYGGSFYLMIDFKNDAEGTYAKLIEQLQPYKHLLKTKTQDGPLTIFISGERPISAILNDPENLVSLDGRPNDLGQGITADKMPVVSTSFKSLGFWNGNGEIPFDIRLKIRQLGDAAHKEGKKLRLWATPDDPASWQVLLNNGVDLLNADNLTELKTFLLSK
ncbi:phosphatidylinositol-specific phospholipase C/glycerophosphodiester phosphodiesterase family protein [uncultured Imperialibacter sp.]|uniref:phosphatidylinositol-specific phospholipase C/glycerophosphodiester phosphodiesterase family protein n=1 Tax=uncultured Imperialibacter sp. TaxID=1672639 RepID=UPI0030D78AD4|tara:strand:+ start:43509 stop:44288 length:780 start_codon:yes stop_codon:yes gene_type:complete